ncbi:MAG TPA: DegT/DnrJ/EryC1/StrS family aminotransferase [Thermomicrobiales bacterium]|nr:DegT/DnrJ/EryC1/StrS family aminotransferase [Thermomicrobiales bacterium]
MTDRRPLDGNPVRTAPFPTWPIHGDAEREYLTQVLESGVWSEPAGGPFITAFEEGFAGLSGANRGVAVTNGSIALMLCLRALGIGAGDEVIVPAYTFLATATAVLEANALPIFADIDPGTYCIDPAAVEALITPRTKAIIPVHLGGHPVDMDRLQEIADRHGLAIIEDAAHAHGAVWNDRPTGSMGVFGCFSMQASKNLTGGEGGIVTTQHDDLAEKIRSLRNCGRVQGGAWYEHHLMGGNYRLSEFHAAVLLAQLERYPDQLARRDANGRYLDAGLAEIEGIIPQALDHRTSIHARHLYSFRVDAAAFNGLTRNEFVGLLKAEGIPCSSGYAIPLDRQPVFRQRAFDVKATGWDPAYGPTRFGELHLPVTQLICDEVVWISQNVLLGEETDMDDVVTAVEKIQQAISQHGVATLRSNQTPA